MMDYTNASLSKAAEKQRTATQQNPSPLGLPELSGGIVSNAGMQAEGGGYSPHWLASQMRELAEKYAEATPERHLLLMASKTLWAKCSEAESAQHNAGRLQAALDGALDRIRLAQVALRSDLIA